MGFDLACLEPQHVKRRRFKKGAKESVVWVRTLCSFRMFKLYRLEQPAALRVGTLCRGGLVNISVNGRKLVVLECAS